MNEARAAAEVVATRTFSGGIVGFNNVLTVHADGTLHLSDRRFNRDEIRNVQQTQIEQLRYALSRPEWQEVESFCGQPVADGFQIIVEGGGKRTGLASPPAEPVTMPPILSEVLGHLDSLWPTSDHSTLDDVATEARVLPVPNFFRLEGEDVQISYGYSGPGVSSSITRTGSAT